MGKEKSSDRASYPELVILNNAFKLVYLDLGYTKCRYTIYPNQADQWVSNMTKPIEDKSVEVEEESRPFRLGLGALVPRQPNIGHLSGSIEKRLFSKLDTSKRRNAKIMEETTTPLARDRKYVNKKDDDDDDEEDDDLDSRTSMFTKKRHVPVTTSIQQGKKKKHKKQR